MASRKTAVILFVVLSIPTLWFILSEVIYHFQSSHGSPNPFYPSMDSPAAVIVVILAWLSLNGVLARALAPIIQHIHIIAKKYL